MDTDIRDELDRCFDDGPPIDDLDLLLARGHTAVRRRRLAGAASIAVAAGVVVGIALVSTGGTTSSTPSGPATGPSATAAPVTPDAVPTDVVAIIDEHPTFGAPAVWFDVDGFVHAKPGVEIVNSVVPPHGLDSVAIEYETSSGRFWFVGRVEPYRTVSWRRAPARDDQTFREWVAADETATWHYPAEIEVSVP